MMQANTTWNNTVRTIREESLGLGLGLGPPVAFSCSALRLPALMIARLLGGTEAVRPLRVGLFKIINELRVGLFEIINELRVGVVRNNQ